MSTDTKRREPYNPTEDESAAIDHAGMVAALAELQVLNDDTLPMPSGVLTCLRAFKAARSAIAAAETALLASHPGHNYITHDSKDTHTVCSALFALLLGLDPNDCSGTSIGGDRILMFVKATQALDALHAMKCTLEDYDEGILGEYLGAEAAAIAEAALQPPAIATKTTTHQ